MGKALVFGIASGAGLQAWRHWPPDGPMTADGVWLLLVVSALTAYLAGRWHGRGRPAFVAAVAQARATAHANASQNVQVAVVVPGQGAAERAAVVGTRLPDDSVGWISGPRFELTEDQLDGMDVAELVEREGVE